MAVEQVAREVSSQAAKLFSLQGLQQGFWVGLMGPWLRNRLGRALRGWGRRGPSCGAGLCSNAACWNDFFSLGLELSPHHKRTEYPAALASPLPAPGGQTNHAQSSEPLHRPWRAWICWPCRRPGVTARWSPTRIGDAAPAMARRCRLLIICVLYPDRRAAALAGRA